MFLSRTGMSCPPTAAIVGVDGAGKTTVFRKVVEELRDSEDIYNVSEPTYMISPGSRVKKRLSSNPVAYHAKGHPWIHTINSLLTMIRGRVIEPRKINDNSPDILMYDRDKFQIDPAVYAMFYRPRLEKKTMLARLESLHRLNGRPYPDMVFFLTIDPEIAIRRIEQRIQEEKEQLGIKRGHRYWRQKHEELDHLTRLQNQFRVALETLQELCPVDVYEIETDELSPEEVSERIQNVITTRRDNNTMSEKKWIKFSTSADDLN